MTAPIPLLLLLAGCTRAPTERLFWREAWEMIAITDDGTLLDARTAIGNTGLLAGQGHLTMDMVSHTSTPLQIRRDASPSAVHRTAGDHLIRLLGDELQIEDSAWTLVVREGQSALDATIVLANDILPIDVSADATARRRPQVPATTLVEGAQQWMVGAPLPAATLAGAWRSGEQGGILRGYGMAIRRSGDLPPSGDPVRTGVYIVAPRWSFAAEVIGDAGIGWFADETGVRTSRTVKITREGRRVLVALQPEVPMDARVDLDDTAVTHRAWAHFLLFERWAASLVWDPPDREIRLAQARIRGLTGNLEGHGAWIRTGPLTRSANSP